MATTALYAVLIQSSGEGRRELLATRWLSLAVISVAGLTFYNFQAVRNRAEDFSRRLPIPGNGYRFANPVPIADGVAFTEMEPSKYAAAILKNGVVSDIPMSGDALSVAGSATSIWLYSELTGRKSVIVRLPRELGASSRNPSRRPRARVVAQREMAGIHPRGARKSDRQAVSNRFPQRSSNSLTKRVPASRLNGYRRRRCDCGGGNVSDPHLLLVRHDTRDVSTLPGFLGPVRYPSISPDGKRLAFSRRDRGSWHLFVRTLATGDEQQLTHASCNAISPSWINTQTLLYATDCGRGVGLSAIARVVVPN